MVPAKFYKVQCELAKNFKYLDYSLTPATAVNVIDENDKTYDASVIDWRDVDWKKYLASGSCDNSRPYGPYVAIYWLNDKKTLVVPLGRIVVPGHDSLSASDSNFLGTMKADDGNGNLWQRKALWKSIESCGKKVCNAGEALGTSKLSCFWPEDGEWYDADALDPSSISLDVLASHVMFTVAGKYCPVYYEEDYTTYLIPLHYIRKRKACPFPLPWR
jgi:hypothetical protein